ncbi:hypothetical protein SASC598J21_002930, partial [Snodgrassella alvi SCGC AB-598-J21]
IIRNEIGLNKEISALRVVPVSSK